jgi:citronellol/citronellal dehydrogenase
MTTQRAASTFRADLFTGTTALAIDEAWQRWGRLDVLVNNAGGQFAQSAIDFSPKGWLSVIDTNLNGTWYDAERRTALARQRRHRMHRQYRSRYLAGCSRHGAFRRSARGRDLSVQDGGRGMGATRHSRELYRPGLIETEGIQHYEEKARQKFSRDSNPLRRTGSAETIANACIFLASPSADFTTGEVLTIDGGQQLWGDVWATPKPPFFNISD